MTDILIPDVPDKVLATIDNNAKRLGISRVEYVHRLLAQERPIDAEPVTLEHLKNFAQLTADLNDPEVMSGAWS